ncbi:hypothetical protein U9M48_034719 [Paspalum notatum var. saurae]|uniref:VQ domain-containing protein n=1 Tax=Paspalum notatum var. saurae TaxID=547442 RepID=A0AAQ3UAI7_PASNO
MLVTAAAARMDSASTSPAWLPTDRHQGHRHGPAPSPSAAPVPHQHPHPRSPARRRVAKRRPRPSRRLPTTFISADPASFRRMVHQVTGADDAGLAPPPLALAPPLEVEALCRSSARPGAMLLALPTLDTSALLLAAGASSAAAARAPSPRGDSAAGSALATGQAEPGGVAGAGAGAEAGGPCGGGGGGCFPTLDSWDADALFY